VTAAPMPITAGGARRKSDENRMEAIPSSNAGLLKGVLSVRWRNSRLLDRVHIIYYFDYVCGRFAFRMMWLVDSAWTSGT
jgi:hypothetical protein